MNNEPDKLIIGNKKINIITVVERNPPAPPPERISDQAFYVGRIGGQDVDHFIPDFYEKYTPEPFETFFLQKMKPYLLECITAILTTKIKEESYIKFPKKLVVYLAEYGGYFHQDRSRRNKCVVSIDYSSLFREYMLNFGNLSLQDKKLFRNVKGNIRGKRDHRYSPRDLKGILKHEIDHALEYKAGRFYKYDPHKLYTEAFTTINELNENKLIKYPKRNSLIELRLEIGNEKDASNHDFSFFMGVTIGLFIMKTNFPNMCKEYYVTTNSGEEIPLNQIDFKDLMKDENRPFLLQPLPGAVKQQLKIAIQKCKPLKYIDLYETAATYLGIPKKEFLATRTGFWRTSKITLLH